MWFGTKRSTVTIGLVIALIVALGVICYLIMTKNSTENIKVVPQIRQAPSRPEPIMKPKGTVVLFYADWCGHSKKMMPDWKEASRVLSQEGYQIVEKEADQAKEEIQSQSISGFPTVRLYPQGYPGENFINYEGDRSTQSIINFVRSGGKV